MENTKKISDIVMFATWEVAFVVHDINTSVTAQNG